MRNENGPVFASTDYSLSIFDTTVIGTIVLTVTATDADGDIIEYTDVRGGNFAEFFYLNPRTGQLSVKQSLLSTHESVFKFKVKASDQYIPPRLAFSNVTVFIQRDSSPPRFVNDPYRATILETAVNGTSVFRLSAVDNDPRGILQYEVVGVGVAPAFFAVNQNTGLVTVYNDRALQFDRGDVFTLRVQVYDSAYPGVRDTSDLTINVLRNVNSPVFTVPTYVITIPDTYLLGRNITQVQATDADGDYVRYQIMANQRALEYYYMNPDTGIISLKKPLTEGSHKQDTLNLRASDQGVPEKFGFGLAVINIIRDNGPPHFTQQPYITTTPRDVTVNSTVILALAVDDDLQGDIVYKVVGNYPAPTFFNIDSRTGAVRVIRSVELDSLHTNMYYVSIIAYDSVYPNALASATATVNINRNPNGPLFSSLIYERTIDEDTVIGSLIVDANATDFDGDVIRFSLQGDDRDSEFFYLNEDTGYISLKKNLLETNINQFRFTVIASDQNKPVRLSTSEVIINIIRDEAAPRFVSLPYETIVLETADVGTTIYRVTAVDADRKGTLNYLATGDFQATFYFGVEQTTGVVTVRNNLRDDILSLYTLRIIAYDDGSPDKTGTATVNILLTRNPSTPVFDQNIYEVTIPAAHSLGATVVEVNAQDQDGDVLRYSLETDSRRDASGKALQYFYIVEQSGIIYLRLPLIDDPDNTVRYTMLVKARDQRNNEKQSFATVIVNVIRNKFLPVFLSQPYVIRISENTDPGTEIYRMSAFDQDISAPGALRYGVMGDSIAPFYFDVNKTSGVVTLKNDLKTDVANFNYVLRVNVHDIVYPNEVATATIDIRITRNDNPPIFTMLPYRVTINETTGVGVGILQVKATDADNHRVIYRATEDEETLKYFYLSTDTGIISVKQPLTSHSQVDYRLTVVASDQGTPEQTAQAVVFITVIRDQGAPVFLNTQNYQTVINEIIPIGSNILTVTAQDGDLLGTVRYKMIGDYPAQSFFSLDPLDGQISTIVHLKTDSLRSSFYVVRIIAFDSVRPDIRTTATVGVTVLRNPSAPSFLQTDYATSISETVFVGSPVLNVTAVDRDTDDYVTYEIVSQTAVPVLTSGSYFYVDRMSGIITLRESLMDSPVSRFSLLLQACDSGFPTQCANVTVHIDIIRNLFLPVFENQPYLITVQETMLASDHTVLLTVTATDRDLSVNGQIIYEQVFSGTSFFNVNSTTGQITLKSNLMLDTRLQFMFQVSAFDSKNPRLKSTADVTVFVVRNPSAPRFLKDQYEASIPESFPLGDVIVNSTAVDSDGDKIHYSIVRNAADDGLFYINPDNGLISLRRLLSTTTSPQYMLTLIARDQRVPEQTATTLVFISVLRDNSPPFFMNEPYVTTVTETTEVNTTIMGVMATDTDLMGRLHYESVGVYPATTFFTVNELTGNVYLVRSLLTDSLLLRSYTLKIVAYDDAYPYTQATSDVTVTVIRNENGPVFIPSATYERTISEDVIIGTSVVSVSAIDRDSGDVVTYRMLNSSSSGSTYFFVDQDTGVVSTRKTLTEAPLNLYTLTIQATDDRGRFALSSVRIIITRITDAPPRFVQTPYKTTIEVTRPINGTVFHVQAVDDDPGSRIRYETIGYFPGTEYFTLNRDTGEIILTRSFVNDQFSSQLYVLQIQAYDVFRPDVRVAENVHIEVIRNPNPPVFHDSFYVTTISESVEVGASILKVIATDADGDKTVYAITDLSGSMDANTFFYLNPSTGIIYVKSDLTQGHSPQYTFNVQARDQSYPEKFGSTSVQINIDRDQSTPQFDRQTYLTTILETLPVNSSQPIVTVLAVDRDVQDHMVYEAVGDGSALAFFRIDPITGAIFVKTPLLEDSLVQYTLRVKAYDSFYPLNAGFTTVLVNVIRNPSGPVFTKQNYLETRSEYTAVGSLITTVTAADSDGDVAVYTLLGSPSALRYFYVSPDTGGVYLKTSLMSNRLTNQYILYIKASDQRGPVRSTNTTLMVNVRRKQAPFFINVPYEISITEKAPIGRSVYQVTAVDVDVENEITYSVTGEAPAPSYFSVNSTTGVISARASLMVDTVQYLVLWVQATDGHQTATVDVNIFVIRNQNPPIFIAEPYGIELREDFSLGSSFFNVTAVDADNDRVLYQLLGESSALEYFYLNPATGHIFLTRRLTETNINAFKLTIRASDQRSPEQTADTIVQISVKRNQFPPDFVMAAYKIAIPEYQPVNSTIYNLQATDRNPRPEGNIVYEATGLYPAQTFFSVVKTSGDVKISQSLKNDGLARGEYTLQVIAYNSAFPAQKDTVHLSISVGRNLNVPVFSKPRYSTTVDEKYPLGRPLINITAMDNDEDEVEYAIIRDNTGGSSLSFFFMELKTGSIYLRRPLTDTTVSQFMMTVLASDSGRPMRKTEVEVVVFVRHDLFAPVFQRTPYIVTIPENTANGSHVFAVMATDRDPVGQVMYMVVGVPPAPSLFTIRQNGNIVVRGDLRNDLSMLYVLRVRAYDSANPEAFTEEDVTINIRRNVNMPTFGASTFSARISEAMLIGNSVIQLTATDVDNDRLTYSITRDQRCRSAFYIAGDSGIVYLRESVLHTADSAFTCTVMASDNGYPHENTVSVTMLIGVDRDTELPQFTNGGRYSVVVQEDMDVGRSILRVSAFRTALVGRIFYQTDGDYPAPSFFDVNNVTGDVRVKQDLRHDNLQLGSYTLKVKAYDTEVPYLKSTAEVFVTILRNLNGPIFWPAVYRVTVHEDTTVGTYIQKLNVSDPDGNLVKCSLSGNGVNHNFFRIDPSTCLVSIKEPLVNDMERSTEYTITVIARDAVERNPQFASASVIVKVLRDIWAPQFMNLPSTLDLTEHQTVGHTVFSASATDRDREGVLTYELIGLFPAQSFFEVRPRTGEVVLRNSLLSDSIGHISYTIRIQVYDSLRPDSRTHGDLTVHVQRNINGPVFTKTRYEVSVEEMETLGNIILQVTATDADNDRVTYISLGGESERQLFYLNPESGSISLRSPATQAARNQYVFEVQATDNRVGNLARVSQTSVVITVLRDRGPPVFHNTPYVVNVPITQAVNSTFFNVLAIDPDPKGQMRYRLDGFSPGTDYFSLQGTTGEIFVRQDLTRNTDVFASYTLLVSAYDSGNSEIISSESVQVNILRNLFSPVISPTQYSKSIYDFQPVGSSVFHVTASDDDITSPENTFTFKIATGSTANEFFTIDPFSGLVRVNKDLTRSTTSYYVFEIVAYDHAALVRSSSATATVSLIRNSGIPEFVSPGRYDITVSEIIPVLENIVTVRATDSDAADTQNGQIRYSLTSSPEVLRLFQIDSVGGNITARVSLTTATDNLYQLMVRASDRGVPTHMSETIVTVRIRREGLPFFEEAEYTVTRSEDAALHTTIIQLHASDPLGRELTYEITGDGLASTLFRIDPASGLVTLAQSLKTDRANTYIVRVVAYSASDAAVKTTTLIRVVVMRNVHAPRFHYGPKAYTLSEDQALGVEFGRANATDVDTGENGQLTYSIASMNSNPIYARDFFYINPTSGTLSVTRMLSEDESRPVRYVLSVVATDNGVPRRSDVIEVTVNVVRNRNGPVFMKNKYELDIDENIAVGSSLLQVSATDVDGDRIVYKLLSSIPASLYFSVDANSGEFYVVATVALDSTIKYMMTVQAKDTPVEGAMPRMTTVRVIINVRRNANAPVFPSGLFNITISEYTDVQSAIAVVKATDADPRDKPSGIIVYSIKGISFPPQSRRLPNNFAFFVISPSTGEIYLAQKLIDSAGIPSTFYLEIEASDSAVPPKTSTKTLTISIVRNQNAPLFTSPTYSSNIEDTSAIGRSLFVVTAIDADEDVEWNKKTPNAYIDYMIDPAYPSAVRYFGVTKEGLVYVRNSLLTDRKESYSFYVIAIDKSWQPLSSRAPIIINVKKIDVGIRKLGFTSPVYYISVEENTVFDPRHVIPILDLDVENQNIAQRVSCSILLINSKTPDHRAIFNVRSTSDGKNCQLYLISNMDREQGNRYNITIGVRHHSHVTKRQVASVFNTWQVTYVIMSVNDVNDNAPQFTYPRYPSNIQALHTYISAISIDTPPNSIVGEIMALDPDFGENGTVSYSLQRSSVLTHEMPFYVNTDGDILSTADFSHEKTAPRQFVFTAVAHDNSYIAVQTTKTNYYVNLIENRNRFILVVMKSSAEEVIPKLEHYRRGLQNVTGRVVLVEIVRARQHLVGKILDYDPTSTDVVFVVVNSQTFYLEDNSDNNIVTSTSYQSQQFLLQVRQSLVSLNAVIDKIRVPFDPLSMEGSSTRLGGGGGVTVRLTKSYVWWLHNPWAALVSLACIIILLAIVAIIILLHTWARYRMYLHRFAVFHTSLASPDFTEPPSFLREYETQSLNMYVPPDETVQELGEINMNFEGDLGPPPLSNSGPAHGSAVIRNPIYQGELSHSLVHEEGTTML
ncbi:protocadherin Fat 4-like [Gigantopelta aegis]|uniref:protocadherin Fat 4-like n=1 Tax=Gigantopelta aegis TaxID=1735272 RepID=UPI001B887AA9|nr:protocadherin Fat 4-like [Gigantopelta aegis]